MRGGAGSLNRRITIHKRPTSETQDAVGASSDLWPAQYDNVPAALETLGGKEFPLAQKRHQETTARFRIRYRAGIQPLTHSISYIPDMCASPILTQYFDIHAVNDVEGRRVELELEVSETK